MPRTSPVWTPETLAELRRLWVQVPQISARAIARQLKLTVNQVVGKVHRLKLNPRDAPVDSRKAQEAREQKAVQREDACSAFVPRPALPRTTATCKWPVCDDVVARIREGGDPYCGKPAVATKSFCQEHMAKAYVQKSRARRITSDKYTEFMQGRKRTSGWERV